MIKRTIFTFLFLLTVSNTSAQETIAKFKYEDAEKAFIENKYQECLDNLDEAEKLLGQTAPNILHLKILAQYKIIEQNPFESYERLELLKANCKTYLRNYDIQGLEQKYREVYDIDSALPNDKSVYEKLKKEHEESELLISQKLQATQSIIDSMLPMVLVEGGEMRMGGQPSNPLYTLTDFYIGKYEVTQELWEYVMGSNPSKYKCSKCPVTNVSWYEVQNFIGELKNITKMNYTLPSEAQWEYAARGGKQSKGYKYSGSNSSKKVAWHSSQVTWSGGKNRPYEVGTKQPNELGIHDMSGNVYEWCSDWYATLDKNKDNVVNPMGPESGEEKVNRGGSYASSNLYCEVNRRYNGSDNPSKNFSAVGFRLALMKE